MSDEILAFASVLRLNRTDVKVLNIRDAYSVHRVVYGLFENVRNDTQSRSSVPSGISFVDKGGDFNFRQILIISNRRPHQTPQFGVVETKPIHSDFLKYDRYGFEVTINPSKRDSKTGKVVPVKGRDEIVSWFTTRAVSSWGFSVIPDKLQIERIGVQTFSNKDGKTVTHGSATFRGALEVVARDKFLQSFIQGIGRGRAFGFGLLQIIPLISFEHRKDHGNDHQ